VVAEILRVVRTGLPLSFAAAAGGVTVETLSAWRNEDSEFGKQFEEARLASVQKRWRMIQEAGKTDWRAIAWGLERTHPREFSRPEIQLAVTNQTTMLHQTLVVSAEVAESIASRVKESDERFDRILRQKRGMDREEATTDSQNLRFR
jgi:hypothetical protein